MSKLLSVFVGVLLCLVAFGQADADLVEYAGGADLDGVDDLLDLGDVDLDGDMTLACWVKFKTVRGNEGFITKRNAGGQRINYMLRTAGSGHTLLFTVRNASDGDQDLSYPWAVVTNRWYHIAATFDDTAKDAYLYVDGLVVASSTDFLAYPGLGDNQNDEPTRVGSDEGAAGWLHGDVQEVAIYDEAITPGDVMILAMKGGAASLEAAGGVAAHTHLEADITDLGLYANEDHSHAIDDIVDLADELASRVKIVDLADGQYVTHVHVKGSGSNATGLPVDVSTVRAPK